MLVAMTLSEGTVLRKYLYAFESESCGDVEEGEIYTHGKIKNKVPIIRSIGSLGRNKRSCLVGRGN